MRTTAKTFASVLALVGLVAAAPSRAGVTVPHLDHGAPYLGRPLAIELRDAAPLAPVTLFLAPTGGHSTTPFGVLELQRHRIVPVASGTTDALGRWSTELDVPLDPALAEQEHHYQALVLDASAPAGAVLSDAFGLRLLGPRVYASTRDVVAVPNRSGLAIVDALRGTLVASIDLGPTDASIDLRAKPVLDGRCAVGAVMASRRELVFFDAAFGTRIGSVAFRTDCSRELLVDATGTRAYVLETGAGPSTQGSARVHVVDLAARAIVATLSLPNASSSTWCASRGAREAFVAETDAFGRASLRRVGLEPLVDRGAIALETTPGGSFVQVAFALGQVFATTHRIEGFTASVQLARVTITGPSMTLSTRPMTNQYGCNFVALPGADRLVVWTARWDLPWYSITEEGLSAPTTPVPFPPMGPYLGASDLEEDGTSVWVLDRSNDEPGDPTEPGQLHRYDFATHAWSIYPRAWPFEGPQDVERLHDALVDLVCVSTRHVPPPIDRPGELLLATPDGASERHVVLGVTAEALLAAPIP